ncbi:unnamed protein product [Mesocestoides corti]|uniref:Secreted protein n=1 Tax=Mesocestoides corti TaxID=53468 RepID=A0A0R3U2Q3_MESCO|nr:unnamed protein product [Mesocestoides corti]
MHARTHTREHVNRQISLRVSVSTHSETVMADAAWISLLIFLALSAEPTAAKIKEGELNELLQELSKEPPPETVWMLHEEGNILDDTWNPSTPDNGELFLAILCHNYHLN